MNTVSPFRFKIILAVIVIAAAAISFLYPHMVKNNSGAKYKIGVCDWMLLKRQRLGAFYIAGEIGVTGVEVDMGKLGDRESFQNRFRDVDEQIRFQNAAAYLGIEICSIALSAFYGQPLAGRDNLEALIDESLWTMKQLDVKVAFLPLGVHGDLVKYPELRPVIIEKLKMIARKSEPEGIIWGIETSYDAEQEARLIDEVGSPSVKSYFNFSNALQNGRDVCRELTVLGKDRIIQIHCTDEDGVLLEYNERLNMKKVKKTLDTMGWTGWLVMERSRDKDNPHDIHWNYGSNAGYLNRIFLNQ